jgi:hypothetical protein
MTISISYSLIIGLIRVLTQAARAQQSSPLQLPAATTTQGAVFRLGISPRCQSSRFSSWFETR